jgi:hypothetical protein
MMRFLAHPRTLAMKLGVPLLFALPFVVVTMPLKIKIGGLAMLIIFTGFFGAAVAFVRQRAEGHLQKIRILPIPIWKVFLDLILAGAAMDILQLGTVLGVFMLINSTSMAVILLLEVAGFLFIIVVLFNMLGILFGMVMRSNSEIHLFGALGAGLIGCLSGIFPTPQRIQGLIDMILPWNPLYLLSGRLEGLVIGTGTEDTMPITHVILVGCFFTLFLMRAFDWRRRSAGR